MAMRDAEGATSLRSSSCLAVSSGCSTAFPVTFPPGFARLATRPSATGSFTAVMTIGIVVVARFAASVAGVPVVMMTSTPCRTSAAARSGSSSSRSAKRSSRMRFCPST